MPLELSLWVDRSSLEPDREGRCALAIELQASGARAELERRTARTVLAIDVSASMEGEPLAQVVRSVDRLLDALDDESAHEIGVVAFSESALRVVDPVPVDAAGKRLVRSRVGRLFAESGTNIEAGLNLAAEMLADAPASMRRGVILLSDGAPNVGAHTADSLREVVRRHRPSVSFFSLGYGLDHAEDVLSAIGESGGGGYEFIPDPTACARSFARALGAQGDVVASGIELVVAPAEGVEVARFIGREDVRYSRDGVVVTAPDMVAGGRRLIGVELRIAPPSADRFLVELVQVTARWSSPSARHSASASVSLEVVARQPAIAPDGARRVLLVRADEARDSARKEADRAQFGAAAATLRAVLEQIERVPDFQRNDGSSLADAYELLLDEVTTFERRPSVEAYAMFRKAAVSSKLAVAVPSAARSRGDVSQKLIDHVAGDCPEAWLVAIAGMTGRFVLREENVIGRANDAEIRIPRAEVAHRHAEIFADAGRYWLSDLGSLQPTHVNGKVVMRHMLSPGDVVRIGDVDLRYEEAEP
jgi:Ca-activated chloride channel family protein